MADDRHRMLERRWRESGLVEDEARYLAERLRRGALRERKLELAACLGHPASRGVLGAVAPTPMDPIPAARSEHLLPLERWGRDALLRAAVALAHRGVAEQVPLGGGTRFRAALADLEKALVAEDAHATRRLASDVVDTLPMDPPTIPLDAIRRGAESLRVLDRGMAIRTAWTACPPLLRWLDLPGEDALATIRAELVPWALGYDDPVRSRLTKTAREMEIRPEDLSS